MPFLRFSVQRGISFLICCSLAKLLLTTEATEIFFVFKASLRFYSAYSVANDFFYLPVVNCSAIDPSAQAGMNDSAPTITMTPIKSATNKGVCVGSVPRLDGTCFFFAREPAMA